MKNTAKTLSFLHFKQRSLLIWYFKNMILFFVGIIEMLIVTVWTKFVTKTQVLASGVITVINVLIWYYVLETIVNNISDWKVVVLYALGCAVGTMLCTYYFQIKESKTEKLSKTKDLSGGTQIK